MNIKRSICGVSLLTFLAIGDNAASSATFDFTKTELVSRIDANLKDNATDPGSMDKVNHCKTQGSSSVCEFTEHAFQHSLTEFKKMNLANGPIHQKLIMTIDEEAGKVSKIGLVGTREDPLNLIYFGAQLATLMEAINPSLSVDAATKLALDLGVARGDSSDTIGQPVDQIEDWAALKCVNFPSNQSLRILCVIEPRY